MSAFDTRFGRVAILNCEDAWHLGPAYLAMLQGATILLTCAATPSGPPTQLPDAELWLTVNRAYAVLLEVFNLFVNRAGDEGTMRFCGSSHRRCRPLQRDGARWQWKPLERSTVALVF